MRVWTPTLSCKQHRPIAGYFFIINSVLQQQNGRGRWKRLWSRDKKKSTSLSRCERHHFATLTRWHPGWSERKQHIPRPHGEVPFPDSSCAGRQPPLQLLLVLVSFVYLFVYCAFDSLSKGSRKKPRILKGYLPSPIGSTLWFNLTSLSCEG